MFNQNAKNEKLVRGILQDEITGDVQSALNKMHPNYSMTWVYKRRDGVLFPKVTSEKIRQEMEKVYVIKGRKYDIKNLLSQNNIVVVEMVESYPDPNNPQKVYRTPLVIVLEIKNGKIYKGRHYCDPQISYEFLSESQVNQAFN